MGVLYSHLLTLQGDKRCRNGVGTSLILPERGEKLSALAKYPLDGEFRISGCVTLPLAHGASLY
jgi:hypothetical protein